MSIRSGLAGLVTLIVTAFTAIPASATPVLPDGQALYTIEYDYGDGQTRLGVMGADGVVTPIGEGNDELIDVRDADYDWGASSAFLLANGYAGVGSCEVWTVDLETGLFTYLWDVRQDGDTGSMFCDGLVIANDEVGISGSFDDSNFVIWLDVDTGNRISVSDVDIAYQSAEYSSDSGDTVAFYSPDEITGYFYDGFGGAEISSTSLSNVHSLAYTQDESALWFTDWDEGVIVGTVDPENGTYDVYTDNLRFSNGDQWGTDAIFIGPSAPNGSSSGLADTGVDASSIALVGIGLAAAGALAVRRRRS